MVPALTLVCPNLVLPQAAGQLQDADEETVIIDCDGTGCGKMASSVHVTILHLQRRPELICGLIFKSFFLFLLKKNIAWAFPML